MRYYVKLFTNTVLLILGVFGNERLARTVTLSGNVLLKHKAVHKVLAELTHAQAQEALAEEKARIQRVVEQEAKKAYERDTGEEMVQMINAKITSLRAEQALKKVIHAQDILKNIDKEVFQTKLKSSELARKLIQVENDLINAQIEYISTNNESGIYNEKNPNFGQDLLDILSVKYMLDTPQEKFSIKNEVKKLKYNTRVPNLNSIYNQYNPVPAYSDYVIANVSSPVTRTISKNLTVELTNYENARVPYNQSIMNSSYYSNPGLNFGVPIDDIPIPPNQLLGQSPLGKFEPSFNSADITYDNPLLRNQSVYFNPGSNFRIPQNEVQIPFPQMAQFIPDQDKLVTDSNPMADVKLMNPEFFKTSGNKIIRESFPLRKNYLPNNESMNYFNISQFPFRNIYSFYNSNVNKDPFQNDNLQKGKIIKNVQEKYYNNYSTSGYKDIYRHKRVFDSSNNFPFTSKPPDTISNSKNQPLKNIFPKLVLNSGPILGLGKGNALKFVNGKNSDIDVRDILTDLKNRKYIKGWNV